jgi:hypothetical protein
MKSFEEMQFFPMQEELVNILIKKTQNNNPLFFRVLVAYHLTKVASMMRIDINTLDRGIIPVNLYAIALSPSGSAKGFSTNIIEEHVINQFKDIPGLTLSYLADIMDEKYLEKGNTLVLDSNVNNNFLDYTRR